MRRTLVAAVILVLIFTMWFLEVNILGHVCGEIIEKSEGFESALKDNGDIQKAENEFFSLWEENKKILEFIISHDETEEIDILSVRLKTYVESQDTEEAILILREIKECANEIIQKSKVDVSTVFYIVKGGLYAGSN